MEQTPHAQPEGLWLLSEGVSQTKIDGVHNDDLAAKLRTLHGLKTLLHVIEL
jgi:hypothetical protein